MNKETVAFDASATVSASVSQSEAPVSQSEPSISQSEAPVSQSEASVKASERVPSPLNHPPARRFSKKVKGEGGFAKCGLGRVKNETRELKRLLLSSKTRT